MNKFLSVVFLTLFAVSAVFANPSDVTGNWDGSWTGDSSGKFTMSLKKDDTGKIVGTLDSQPDGGGPGSFNITKVDVADSKLIIFMADDNIEITLTCTVTGNELTGTYAVKSKGEDAVIDKGNIKATKK